MLVVVRRFDLLQLADLHLEHGGFDLRLLQGFVIGRLGGGGGRCTLRGGQRLFGVVQLLAQAAEFGLLGVVRCFDLLQLANLRLEHGSFDLGFFQCFVIGRLGGGSGRCTLRGGQRLFGVVQLLT